MVDHDQKGIKAIGRGKVGDEIARDLLEGAGAGGRNREEQGSRWMGVDLVLLARGAPSDITVDIRGKAWPPKLCGNQLASLENSRMASSGVVMVTSHDRVAQVCVSGHVDTALIG